MPDTLETLLLLELRKFMREEPVAFYDLVHLCRNKEHVPLESSRAKISIHGFGDFKAAKLTISAGVKSVVQQYIRGRFANLRINVDWGEGEGE